MHCFISAFQYCIGIPIFASALPRLSSTRAFRVCLGRAGLLLSLFRLPSLLMLWLRVTISCHVVGWWLVRRGADLRIASLLNCRRGMWTSRVVCSIPYTHLPLVMVDHHDLLPWLDLDVLHFSLIPIPRSASQTRRNQTDRDYDEHHDTGILYWSCFYLNEYSYAVMTTRNL